MAHVLAATPRSGITVQVCGDAHLSNIGVFASPERRVVFGLDDFDETLPGRWEWDVRRLAASLAVAARDNGFSPKQRRKVVLDAVGRYRRAMREFAKMTNLAVWYARLDIEEELPRVAKQLDPQRVANVERDLAKARTRDSVQALDKLSRIVDGAQRIVSHPPQLQ